MSARVALVEIDGNEEESLREALGLIGGVDDLNTPDRPVVVKVGVFDHREECHTTVSVVRAIANCFHRPGKIYLAESDNYKGTGLERLQIWSELFSDRVVPFSLSDDPGKRELHLAGQDIGLSQILFKPNVLVDTHILRSYERGSILKNLFGCIPTPKKAQFHKEEIFCRLLADIYEAVGGIDLAVLDGTYFRQGTGVGGGSVQMNVLLVGRDAVAVEAAGAALAGLKPEKMAVIGEFARRGLGEGDLDRIQIVGTPLDRVRESQRRQTAKIARSGQAKGLSRKRNLTLHGITNPPCHKDPSPR